MTAGTFYKRGPIKNQDNSPLDVLSLAVGNTINVLGISILITDADDFTRDYFRCLKFYTYKFTNN
jgi:hypothetical protein